MMENEKKRTGSWKRTVLIIVCAVLAVVLALLIFATAYVESFLNRINRDFDDSTLSSSEIDAILSGEATGTGPTVDEDDIQMGEEPTETIGGDEIINILPQDFFMHCAILILAILILGCIALMVVDLLLHRKKRRD